MPSPRRRKGSRPSRKRSSSAQRSRKRSSSRTFRGWRLPVKGKKTPEPKRAFLGFGKHKQPKQNKDYDRNAWDTHIEQLELGEDENTQLRRFLNNTKVFQYVKPTTRNIRIAAYLLYLNYNVRESTGNLFQNVVAAYLMACEHHVSREEKYSPDMKKILTGYGISAGDDDLPQTNKRYKITTDAGGYTIYGLFDDRSFKMEKKLEIHDMYDAWVRFLQLLNRMLSKDVSMYRELINPSTKKNYTSLEDFVYEKKVE